MSTHLVIWKILRTHEVTTFIENRKFHGSDEDLRDGFIHLSTDPQVLATIEKHFTSNKYLWAALCRTDLMKYNLRWEPSRAGALFPHLYRQLEMEDVVAIYPVTEEWRDDRMVAKFLKHTQ